VIKVIYSHSNSKSSDNERHKQLHVIYSGSWEITSRRIIKTLRRAVPHNKWMETPIAFDASDYPKNMSGDGQLPLVVSLTITNIRLYHVLDLRQHPPGGPPLMFSSVDGGHS
jgi:hypothetical protein